MHLNGTSFSPNPIQTLLVNMNMGLMLTIQFGAMPDSIIVREGYGFITTLPDFWLDPIIICPLYQKGKCIYCLSTNLFVYIFFVFYEVPN